MGYKILGKPWDFIRTYPIVQKNKHWSDSDDTHWSPQRGVTV